MIELFDLSERRACRLVGLSRDSYRHEPEASAQTQALSGRIVEIAHQRRRFGYRRVHDLLRPEFPSVNHKRVYRLYRNANLAVRKRKKAKRPMHERVPLQLATRVNQVWSMDFVSDSLSNGRRLKYLTVADDFSHECVDITVDYGISGQYVTRLLDQAALFRGYPQVVRTDNVLNAIGVAQKEQAHSWLSKQPKKQRYLAALPNGHFHVLRRASIHHNEHKIQQ
jgi:putative transposase